MTLLRSLVLACALALPITATQAVITDITAEAAAKKAKPAKTAKKATKAKAKKVAYKHCGTYKYWKGGKCMDARAKKG